jgi:hypothetical protein
MQNITVNIYNPPPNQPPPRPNIPRILPSSPLEVGFHASQLFKGPEGRLHFNLTTILNNNYTFPVTVSWVYLRVLNVSYADGSLEKWDISNNSTTIQNIEPNSHRYLRFGISEYGFVKEPKVVNLKFEFRLSDPESVKGKFSASISVTW